MTSAVNTFYIFIAREFHGNYEGVREAIDGDGDGVITYAEFDTFVKSQNDLADFARQDITAVFNTLDKKVKGKIQDTFISEQGALNASEQAKLDANIELYGRIYDLIESQYHHVEGFVNHYSNLGLTKEKVTQSTFEAILQNTSINNAQNLTEQDVLGYLKQGVAVAAKDGIIEQQQAQIMSHLSLDYQLKDDPDLNALIENYLNTINSTTNIWNINLVHELKGIINSYINTAGFSNSVPDDYDGNYQYNQNGHMSTIQVSRLVHKYETALNNADFSEFTSIIDNNTINSLVAQFLQNKQTELAQKPFNQFNTILEGLDTQSIIDEFKNSAEFRTVVQASEIIGLDDNFTTNGHVHIMNGALANGQPSWSVALSDSSTGMGWTEGSDHFFNGVYYCLGFGGLSVSEGSEAFKKFFTNGVYNQYVRAAFQDIQSNPDKYGINLATCTKKELQNAIIKYMVANLPSILAAAGLNQEDITKCVLSGATEVCKKAQSGSRDMTLEDARAAAKMAVAYLMSTYGSAIHEILQNSGIATEEQINNCSALELENKLRALYNAIKDLNLNETGGTSGTNGTNGNDPTPPTEYGAINTSNLDKTDFNTLKNSMKIELKRVMTDSYYDDVIFEYLWEKAKSATQQGNGHVPMGQFIDKFIEYYNEYVEKIKSADLSAMYGDFNSGYDVRPRMADTSGAGDHIKWNDNDLGIPAAGIFDINQMTEGTVFYDIASIGNKLYHTAVVKYGRDKAMAAYKTFIGYYRAALQAMNSVNWHEHFEPAGFDGDTSFNYETYSANGTHTTSTSYDRTVTRRSKRKIDVNEYSYLSTTLSGTGIYIGADRTSANGEARSFYVFLDMTTIFNKFKTFLDAA